MSRRKPGSKKNKKYLQFKKKVKVTTGMQWEQVQNKKKKMQDPNRQSTLCEIKKKIPTLVSDNFHIREICGGYITKAAFIEAIEHYLFPTEYRMDWGDDICEEYYKKQEFERAIKDAKKRSKNFKRLKVVEFSQYFIDRIRIINEREKRTKKMCYMMVSIPDCDYGDDGWDPHPTCCFL